MVKTDEYERDFNDTAGLKRPGRVDLRVLQNIDDAGDGHPGLQKALRNWFNVAKFNPNDYNIYYCSTETEITQALSDIGSGAGFIYLYDGTITLTGIIPISGGGSYIIQGQGDKSIIDCGGDNGVFNITSVTSLVLRDFKIDANDLTSSDIKCINSSESSDNKILVDNVTIVGDGINGYGIYLASDYSVVRSCTINNINTGIYLTDANKNMVYGNNIQNCNSYGIRCISPTTASEYNIIANNLVYNCVYNIIIDGSGSGVVQYNNLKDNVSYGADYGIYLDNADFNILNGNNCYNNAYYGIYNDDSNYTTINGNMNIDNDDGGILFTGTSQYCSINGNMCKSSTLQSVGITIESNGDHTVVGNNCSQNADGMGIKITNSNYNVITGNLCNQNDGDFVGTTAGIYISGNSDFNVIAGNLCCYNNNINVGGDGYGIYIVDSTCNDNHVAGNNCEGNDVEYLDSGTGTVDDSGDQGSYDLNRFG